MNTSILDKKLLAKELKKSYNMGRVISTQNIMMEEIKMKKLLSLMLTAMLVLSMAACGTPAPETTSSTPEGTSTTPDGTVTDGYELALITDIGTIDDKSFNQGAWEGLKKYADENNITNKYYQPAEKTTDAYIETIGLAVKGGAKVIVTPGYLFEQAILTCQDTYPDVKFILLDGIPNNGAFDDTRVQHVADNTYSVFYAEEEAGFLAGYAAVKDGYRKLGFMGGMAVPAVVRFGYGFVQGAEFAGAELGLAAGELEMKYHYTGGFSATPEAQAQAASWYESGTEVIFACGGAVGNSVMTAAEASEAKMIGVDVDQSAESETVISSALKGLGTSVYQALEAFYAGTFPGGQSVVLNATNDGVSLAMDTAKWNTFSQADYEAIYAKLLDGTIKLLSDTTAATVNDIPVSVMSVKEFTQ